MINRRRQIYQPLFINVMAQLFLMWLMFFQVAAFACTDYEDFQHWIATIDFPGEISGIDTEGNYAYVCYASSNYKLQVYDQTIAGAPVLIGETTTSSHPYGIAVSGNIAVMAVHGFEDEDGLLVFDISDRTVPVQVGAAFPGTLCRRIAIQDTLVYLITQSTPYELRVLSVADPANPVLLDSIGLGTYAYGALVIKNGYAYMDNGPSGLVTVNVSDPRNIFITDSNNTSVLDIQAVNLAIEGNIAVLALRDLSSGRAGLVRYNLNNPAHPTETGVFWTTYSSDHYLKLDIVEGICYFGHATGSVFQLDVSTPSMTIVGTLPGLDGWIGKIVASGNNLHVIKNPYQSPTTRNTIQIVSVSSPDPLKPISGTFTPGEARSIVVSPSRNNIAFVADGAAGMHVLDITDPLNPVILQTLDTPGFAEAIVLDGNTAYLADGEAGLHAINVTDAENTQPSILSTQNTPGLAIELAIQSNYAYVADSGQGLRIINIANPSNIFEVGANDTLSTAQGVVVFDQHAYVTNGLEGLFTLNVSDPENPWIIDDVKDGIMTDARNVVISQGKIFCTDAEDGLVVFDISNPSNPESISSTDVFGAGDDLNISGIFAYVGTGDNVRLIDIQKPEEPVMVGALEVPTTSHGIFTTADYVYVAAGDSIYVCPTQCGFNQMVYPSFIASPQEGFYPFTVDFVNLSEGYGMTYEWDFGDGSPINTEDNPTWLYSAPGDYSVDLVVTNGAHTDSVTVVVSALAEAPTVTGISDIPDDQGGFVYVNFYHSGYDNDGLSRSEMYTVQRLDGEQWINIMSFGAYGDHYYSAQVNTIGNGIESEAEFRVLAHMDEGNWASIPVSGFSLDNIAPGAPTGLAWLSNDHLDWDPVSAHDLSYYQVYGSHTPSFIEADLVMTVLESYAIVEGNEYPWIFVNAVDDNGLQSEPSLLADVSSAREAVTQVTLGHAYPNPFNPSATIEFALPKAGQTTLAVFDISGRLVCRLIDAMVGAGYHAATWHGADSTGRPVPSGTYFSRLTFDGEVFIGRMMLIK